MVWSHWENAFSISTEASFPALILLVLRPFSRSMTSFSASYHAERSPILSCGGVMPIFFLPPFRANRPGLRRQSYPGTVSRSFGLKTCLRFYSPCSSFSLSWRGSCCRDLSSLSTILHFAFSVSGTLWLESPPVSPSSYPTFPPPKHFELAPFFLLEGCFSFLENS